MSDKDQDYDLNNGVQIILNRMKTNPEEFFDNGGRWAWIFKDTLREVMTEIEKAAIFEALKEVRRVEITSRAAATVLHAATDEKEQAEKERIHGGLYASTAGVTTSSFGNAIPKAEGRLVKGGTY
jgi:serine/threonine protein kinase HipA of HipAB toxin-antitoxin module